VSQSSFDNDLLKEQILGSSLDEFYQKYFEHSSFKTTRITDKNLQNKGVDLILENDFRKFFVDEKAQLDYLNGSLPTFAFELSYLKYDVWHQGWLFDENKITTVYYLITDIMVNDVTDISKGVLSFKITGIYRDKLLRLLEDAGLTRARLSEIEKEVRASNKNGKIEIDELNSLSQGNVYFTSGKNEKPINLVLKIKYLTDNNVGSTLILR